MSVSHSKITLIKNAIHNPNEPRHFMTLTHLEGEFCLSVGGQSIAKSERVLAMHEVAHIIIDPVNYFPQNDVNWDYLRENSNSSHCPLKGDARYFDFHDGDKVIENIAWSYPAPISVASSIRGYVAFDSRLSLCKQTEA